MSDTPTFDSAVFTGGDCVTSPPAGKAIRFRDRPDDPSQDPLTFDMWLAAEGSHGPMRHIHPDQVERLTVRSGRLGLWHDGEQSELQSGETAVVPAGDPHRFWNAGEGALHIRGSVTPGLRTERFMRITYGLAREGAPVTPSGMPLNVLRLTVLLSEYDDMLWLAALPQWLQRTGVDLLAPLGRLFGYDNSYPELLP